MRRYGLPALAALLVAVMPAEAQDATVSRGLTRIARSDTTVAVWFFGSPAVSLEAVARAAEAVGARVRRRSRWLHAVSGELPTRALAQARRRSEFRHLQPVARFVGTPEPPGPPDVPPVPRATQNLDSLYGNSGMPMRNLNLFPVAARGGRGAGVIIAILDTGFETAVAAFDSAMVLATWDFVNDDPIVSNQPGDPGNASEHGTATWSLLAANVPGRMIGVAPDATYVLAKTEDVASERRVEEDNLVAALEWADSLGAKVASISLGYLAFDPDQNFSYRLQDLDGDVAVTTRAADRAAERGMLVVVSVGNCGVGGPFCLTSGFRSLNTPSDGDSVIAVGAEDSTGAVATFSSRGPTADGRLKPDFMAPGVAVWTVDLVSGFARRNGTSFSAPLLAGVGALIRQVHPGLSPIDVRDALRNTGNNRASPDSTRGWGRPDGAASVYFPRGIAVLSPGTDSVLTSVTPSFVWDVPDLFPSAIPVRYRLRVARDPTFTQMVLDTSLTSTSVSLSQVQRPGDELFFTLRVSANDGVAFTTQPRGPLIAPNWATLTTLDDPDGSAIREVRPIFRWTSPAVNEPPGPFTYDVAILRDDDGTIEVEATGLAVLEFQPQRELERNTPYRWRVTTRLGNDSTVTASQGSFIIVDDTIPVVTLLFQNFPNPFPNPQTGRSSTCLWFDLARGGRVRLDVLDVRGHVVQSLIPGGGFGASLPAGRYGRPDVGSTGRCDPRLEWDGTARTGEIVPRGIYLARLETPDGNFFKRIVFLGK